MRIIHVVPSVADEGSGPSYSVPRLCEALIAEGNAVTLVALDWNSTSSNSEFVELFPISAGPRSLGRSVEMLKWLRHSARAGGADILHNHGMWQMNALYPARAVKGTSAQLVVSPRGALSEWAMSHGSRLKQPFWRLAQRPALQRATCFHATSESEYEDVRRLGFRQPVAVISNGIDLPQLMKEPRALPKTVLYLGRIHAKKGIDLLLHAWAHVMNHFYDWQLVIAGSDSGYGSRSGHLNQMKQLATELRLVRVSFVDAVYGEEKLRLYQSAELFVLPTYSENFGMTVAEALSAGTPAIVSKGAPWQGLETRCAGWWVDVNSDAIASALSTALSEPINELRKRGQSGREWMAKEFSWEAVGAKMHATYHYLTRRGEPPPWVLFE